MYQPTKGLQICQSPNELIVKSSSRAVHKTEIRCLLSGTYSVTDALLCILSLHRRGHT